ncbi:MAG TPA: hypothetical protein VFG21_07705 [Xanthomonadaceae bacterium]|nr:hypothetical protein [Xanthomonadaceae bacterium]
MSCSPVVRRLIAAGLCLTLAPLANAEQEVRFSNSTEVPVRLKDNSTVVLDEAWNFDAECLSDPDDTCADFPKESSGGGLPPAMTYTASPLPTDGAVIAGQTDITLSWSVTGAGVCKRISTPTTTSWTGLFVPSGSTQSATFKIPTSPETSPWLFELICYADSGSTVLDGPDVHSYVVEPPPITIGNEPNCNIVKEEIADSTQRALFKPAGFIERELTWSQLFPPDRVYPQSYGDKIAVGSKTFHQPDLGNAIIPVKGLYMSIPFVMDSTFHTLSHRPATSALDWPLGSYSFEAADSVYITFSPCKGDFRTIAVTNNNPEDESYTKGCRKQFTQTEGITYGGTGCPLVAGRTYYINIVFEGITDNVLDPLTTSCSDEFNSNGTLKTQDHICDVGLQHD